MTSPGSRTRSAFDWYTESPELSGDAPRQDIERLAARNPSVSERIAELISRSLPGEETPGSVDLGHKLAAIAEVSPVGIATGLGDAYDEARAGNYGSAAASAALSGVPLPGPLEKSIYVMLPALRRLTDAGLHQKSGWGSPDAVEEGWKRLQAGDKNDKELARKIWEEYGAADRDVFGNMPGRAENAPWAWHDLDTSMPSLEGVDGAFEGSFTAGDLFPNARASLRTIDPRAEALPVEVKMGPYITGKSQGGSVTNVREPSVHHSFGAPPLMPSKMSLHGEDPEAVGHLARHELQHATEVFGDPFALDVNTIYNPPMYESAASKRLQELRDARVKQLEAEYGINNFWSKAYSDPTYLDASRDARSAVSFSGYLSMPEERRARAAAFVQSTPGMERTWPGDVDTFDQRAFLPFREGNPGGLPFSMFDPATAKKKP